MKKIFIVSGFLLLTVILSGVEGFAQNNKEVQIKVSDSKTSPKVTVVDSLKTPSPAPKHILEGKKQTANNPVDNEPVTTPAKGVIVPGNKK